MLQRTQKSKKRTRRVLSRWQMRATGQILLTLSFLLPDFIGATICDVAERPHIDEKEKTARWMMHTLNWGVLSTISSRLKGDGLEGGGSNGVAAAVPFGNIYSFVDGPCDNSTGIPYFYSSALDQSMKDAAVNPVVSLTVTEASLPSLHGISSESTVPSCVAAPAGRGDPMNPPCARLAVTGRFVELSGDDGDDADEWEFARGALFQRHPAMEKWPRSHKWFVGKIVIEDLWLIDIFGGASILDVEKYMAVDMASPRETLPRRSMAREYYKLFSW